MKKKSPAKNTPSNCMFPTCHYNQLPPPENSQECFACEGNTDPNWDYRSAASKSP